LLEEGFVERQREVTGAGEALRRLRRKVGSKSIEVKPIQPLASLLRPASITDPCRSRLHTTLNPNAICHSRLLEKASKPFARNVRAKKLRRNGREEFPA
jgi:hypothetical protein